MSGRMISDDEMRVIMAGLLLSVDRLTNALVNVEARLWSEGRLREIVGEEFEKRCQSKGGACREGESRSATWLGRLVRSALGLKVAALIAGSHAG